jgi:hypothetical protein
MRRHRGISGREARQQLQRFVSPLSAPDNSSNSHSDLARPTEVVDPEAQILDIVRAQADGVHDHALHNYENYYFFQQIEKILEIMKSIQFKELFHEVGRHRPCGFEGLLYGSPWSCKIV